MRPILVTAQTTLIQFDDFTMDTGTAELRRGGTVVSLEPQVFDLIRYLAENAGRIISRDDIIQVVWDGRIVSDASISTRINAARKVLGDDGKKQRLIKTVQRRGFRFMPDTHIHDPGKSDQSSNNSVDSALGNSNLIRDRPSVVILPFESLSDDPQQEYLADGLRIDIQNALVKVSGVFLIAAGSANAVRGLSPLDAARKLGVRYTLEGSVRRAGRNVRISILLTDCQSGHIVWSNQYDYVVDDTFQVLDEITAKVLTAINVKLVMGEPARVWNKVLSDLKSLESFYLGINEFFKMNSDGLNNARRHFERVQKRHPGLSIGPTWLALTHWYEFQRGWADDPEEAKRKAQTWAEQAVEMEDADGQAHTVLSHVYLLDHRFDDALTSGRRAVTNRTNCTHANVFYANVLHYCGEHEEAIHHAKLAIRYSPIHPPLFQNILSAACRGAGNLNDALSAAEEASVSSSSDLVSRVLLASIYVKLQNFDLATEQVSAINSIDPAFSLSDFASRQPYKDHGFLKSLMSELKIAGLPD